MFVQIIQGQLESDPSELFKRWHEELRPGAEGYLGTTAGTTPDNEFLAIVRFESEEAARRNSDRPDQGAWWEEVEKRFAGEVRFHDCPDVALFLGGGDDGAGFVQVLEGATSGDHPAEELADAAGHLVEEYRPDVLGGLVAVSEEGRCFEVVYFTSEEEAREAEAQPMPADVAEEMTELMNAMGELTYHDLPSPTLFS